MPLPSEALFTVTETKMAPLCLKTSHVKTILSPGNTDGKITCLTCSVSLWLREVKDAVGGNYRLPAGFSMYHYYYHYLRSHLHKRSSFVRVETSNWAKEYKDTGNFDVPLHASDYPAPNTHGTMININYAAKSPGAWLWTEHTGVFGFFYQ